MTKADLTVDGLIKLLISFPGDAAVSYYLEYDQEPMRPDNIEYDKERNVVLIGGW